MAWFNSNTPNTIAKTRYSTVSNVAISPPIHLPSAANTCVVWAYADVGAMIQYTYEENPLAESGGAKWIDWENGAISGSVASASYFPIAPTAVRWNANTGNVALHVVLGG